MLIGLYRDQSPFKTIRKERLIAIAKEALKQNVKLVVFETKDVNFKNQEINGKLFDGEKWIDVKTPYPTVMINEIPVLKKNRSEGEKKLREKILCTSYLIGNKKDIYNKLSEHNKLKELVIPTITVKKSSEIISYLNKEYSKIVLKPVNGRQGKSIYFVERRDKQYIIKDHVKRKIISEKVFEEFIEELLLQKTYLLQPYVECKTKNGEPYDYRVHVQRNGEGQWSLTKLYPRMGNKNSILSNISRGGHTEVLESFLNAEFGEYANVVKAHLINTAFAVAEYIDSKYEFSLDELGVDLAIDTSGKMWLYEVNPGPQSKYHEEERAINVIAYAKYLTEKHKINHLDYEGPVIGMLRRGTSLTTTQSATYHVSASKDVNFYYFTPEDIQENSIYGYKVSYNGKTYHEFPVPDVIYDSLKGKNINRFKKTYNIIHKWGIPVSYNLKNGSVSKEETYRVLEEGKNTKQYLIPSKKINDIEETFNLIRKYGKAIIKADKGMGGKSIHKITHISEDEYKHVFRNSHEILSQDELIKLLQKFKGEYILQKFITSKTKTGKPFDIRIHMVRDANKNLSIAEIYARLGSVKGIVSNLSSGGCMRKWKDFLIDEYSSEEIKILKKNFNVAIRRIAKVIDKKYGLDIPEVGIDMGIVAPNELYLFEYNIFAPHSSMHEYEIANLMVPYLLTLHNENMQSHNVNSFSEIKF